MTEARRDDVVTITDDALTATVDPLAAELLSLTDAAGRELMTDADPAFWTGHAPILFPIVGAVRDGRYRLRDGRTFAMPQHGFARRLPWTVVARDAASARFRLVDDAGTRAAYPFAFALEAAFAVADATLSITLTLTNRGDVALPASIGFHPAFAWPLPYGEPRAAHRLVFERDEAACVSRIEGALIGPADRPSPIADRVLMLRDELFAADALVWSDVASGAVRYGAGHGPQLDIAFPGAPSLGVWTKPGAAFVCVEPWWGRADPVGYTGAFEDKPGMMILAPGDERRVGMSVTLVP